MAEIKSLSAISEKWTRVTPGRRADFEAGVRSPTKSWQGMATAAEGAYEDGVQQAITKKRYGAGIRAAGDTKWQGETLANVSRWPEGVSRAGDAYQQGFSDYHQTIQSTTLPPRYAAGDPRNLERAAKIAAALHARKVGSK